MAKESRSNSPMHLVKSVAIGTVAAALAALALCFLGAVVISNGVIGEGAMRYLSWAICGIAAFIGCLCAQKIAGSLRLPVCMACACVLLIVMGIVSASMNGTEETTWYCVGITALCALGAALVGARNKKRRR